jgi:hypothetical protein
MRLLVAIAFLAVFLLAGSGCYCAVYYVDVDSIGGQCSEDPSQPGTITQPWCTAIKGFSSAKPGDTVYFRQGVYRQSETIGEWYFSKEADENHRLTFKGYQGEEVIITPQKLRNDPSYWTQCISQADCDNNPNWENIYSTDLTPQRLGPDNIKVVRISHASQDGMPLMLMTPHNENGGPEKLTGEGQWVRNVSNWKLYIWARRGGNPGNYLTEFTEFIYGGSSTIDIAPNGSRAGDNNEADYITFENFIIEGGYYPISVTTDYVELKNCIIRNCYGDGIKVGGAKPDDFSNPDDPNQLNYYNSEYGLIENCDIYNFGEAGIDITGGDYWIVRNNSIHDSVNNRGDMPSTTKVNGIMLKNNNKGTIVEKNKLFNLNTEYGVITLGGCSWDGIAKEGVNLTAKNNIMYNITGPSALSVEACENCSFYNNLVYNSTFSRALIIFSLSNSHEPLFKSTNTKIKNNIFYRNKVNYDGYDYQYLIYSGNSEGLESNYNIIDGSKKYYDEEGTVTKYKSLSDFRETGYEKNSITEEPAFANLEGKDFHLSANSLGINQGTCLQGIVDDDFEGKPRPQGSGCDIGPYEFEEYYCGDGSCNSDKGETNATCPADCTQECVDTDTLMTQYIPQWKRGEISMLALMQKMKLWKAGTGCPPPA